jgi:hypothetical protein
LVQLTFFFQLPPNPLDLHFHIKYNLLEQGVKKAEEGRMKIFTSEEGKSEKEDRKKERRGESSICSGF